MAANADKQDRGRTSRLSSLFKRSRRELVIDGFHQGDIRTDKPVIIEESGAVRGNIYAPEVVIAGAVKGLVVSRTTIIDATGQVWGDVNTGAIEVQPGGKLHGWYNAVDELRYERLLSGDLLPEDIAVAGEQHLPDYMTSHDWPAPLAEIATLEDQREMLRQLRAEAATAIMDRLELERRFDEKVAEVAGEKIAGTTAIREELLVARGELATLQAQQDETAAAFQARERELAIRNDELQDVREQLAARGVEIQELQAAVERRDEKIAALTHEHDVRQEELRAEREQNERQANRIENLEMALQDSLQRTAEQEEALIHWQELAESSEGQLQRFRADLQQARSKLDETGPLVGQLHREAEERDDELLQTREALQQAQARVMTLDGDVTAARQQLKEFQAALGGSADNDPEAHPADIVTAVGELRSALDNASGRVLNLEQEREQLLTRLQEYHERLLWADASQKEATQIATAAQEKMVLLGRRYKKMEVELQQERQQGARWKANVDRTLEMMYAAESRLKELQDQLDAAEAEVAAKADRLTALQTAFAERDEAHKQMMLKVTAHDDIVAGVRAEYEQKMRDQEEELSRVRQSVSQWLARRRRGNSE